MMGEQGGQDDFLVALPACLEFRVQQAECRAREPADGGEAAVEALAESFMLGGLQAVPPLPAGLFVAAGEVRGDQVCARTVGKTKEQAPGAGETDIVFEHPVLAVVRPCRT